MRTLLNCSAALAALLVAGTTASTAGTFIPVPAVTNATTTTVFGINKSDTIAGSFISSTDGLEHGFVGPLSGSSYTTFDAAAGKTEPRALANDGTITGFANNDGVPADYVPFERSPSGTITNVTKNGNPLNYLVQGISNGKDKFGGSYETSKLNIRAYIGQNAQYVKAVKLSIANAGAAARGINTAGDIVGWYYDTGGVQNGFLISGGTATTIDYPDSTEVSSVVEGINDNGQLVGQWTDTGGIIHSFFYNITSGNYKSVDVPGSTSYSQAWGSNDSDLVAMSSDVGSYIYCPGKKCPAGIRTVEKEIYKPLKDMPHAPCVNGCLAPIDVHDRVALPQRHGEDTGRRAPGGPIAP